MSGEQNNCNEEQIEFIIRSAMQTFQDTKVQCLSTWTVIQLKEYLFKTLTIKPEVARQRLIYAGHCLEDSCTIQSILKKRVDTGILDTSDAAQVIHLVYSSNEALKNVISSSLNNKTGLRYRQNATTSSNSTNLINNANTAPNVTNMDSANNTTQFINNPYDYYAAYYQNYYNQISTMMYYQQHYIMQQQQFSMMNNLPGFFGAESIVTGAPAATTPAVPYNQLPQPFFVNAAGAAPFGAFPAGGLGMHFNPINAANPLLYAAVNNNNENFGGVGIVNPAVVGDGVNAVVAAPPLVNNDNRDNAANRFDVLDIIYKAVRFSLLMMVLYLYSSLERFFVVLLSISLIWFVQRQRERRNRNTQLLVQRQNNIENEDPVQVRNNDILNGNAVQAPTILNDNQISSWTVFWTTVSSFFTSLIPENPGPVNAN